jgi:ELWxxDGT repeat protein
LFSAGDATHGYELWVTDGTAAGTHLVADINPGTYTSPGGASYPNSSSPSDLTAIGDGRVVFSAHDGTNGTELWVTDGTAAGTHLVDDIPRIVLRILSLPQRPLRLQSVPHHRARERTGGVRGQ